MQDDRHLQHKDMHVKACTAEHLTSTPVVINYMLLLTVRCLLGPMRGATNNAQLKSLRFFNPAHLMLAEHQA
jgi:hypothetical protein